MRSASEKPQSLIYQPTWACATHLTASESPCLAVGLSDGAALEMERGAGQLSAVHGWGRHGLMALPIQPTMRFVGGGGKERERV